MKYNEQTKLTAKREYLLAQIHFEREDLVQKGVALRAKTRIIDKILNGVHHLTSHPEALLLPFAITLVSRPWRLWTLGISSLGLWRVVQAWRQRIFS